MSIHWSNQELYGTRNNKKKKTLDSSVLNSELFTMLNTANDVNAAAKNGQYNLKEAKQMLSYRKHDAGMLIA
ncbi:hypothetical protein scyTo_0000986 [Scyliorhinus torazame]|uniref:Uncharacterized protein n=1 Tax=Scyliorhinus torazame TaxID=75743 RepID=A0A401P7B8_SCYTO|nr:hypothetical protein [Scyliorhinus torazame]